MRIIAATCLFLTVSLFVPYVSNAQEEVPDFFTSAKFDAAQLASAVNQFVKLGETKTLHTLKKISSRQTVSGKIDVHFRLACICRVLWENRDRPIPSPHLGMYGGGVSISAGQSAKARDWPIYPMAEAGNSFFVVVYGGRGGTGASHRLPISYFTKCQSSGRFRTKEILVPTQQDAEIDAKRLRQSARWVSEFPDPREEQEAWRSIVSQFPPNTK